MTSDAATRRGPSSGVVALWVIVPLLVLGALLYLGLGTDERAGANPDTVLGREQPVPGRDQLALREPNQPLEVLPPPPIELPDGLTVPSIWTVGDLPPEDERVLVTIDARGALTVDGVPCDGDELIARLAAAVEGRPTDDAGVSLMHCLVAADESLWWRPVVHIVQAACAQQVLMDKIHFVVRHRGDGELGQLAWYLPRDGSPPPGLRTRERPKTCLRVRPDGEEVDPERLLEPLRAWLQAHPEHAAPEIDAHANTPVRLVLQLFDVTRRAGARRITAVGQPAPGFGIAPNTSDGPALHVDMPGREPPPNPLAVVPVRRVRNGFAGFPITPNNDDAPELEEEVPPEVDDLSDR